MKKVIRSILVSLCIAVLCSLTVLADIGPKPSVNVKILNLPETTCYVTLLSETASTGPHSAWDGTGEPQIYEPLTEALWQAFAEYQDPDGFYFLQTASTPDEEDTYHWTYYPPQTFKILLYFPEENVFLSSDVCHHYAFDTYYTVDMEGMSIQSTAYDTESSSDKRLDARESYEYGTEILGFALRALLTFLIEMAVALLFGFRGKKVIGLLALVNGITQLLLNAVLMLRGYLSGPMTGTPDYVLLELAVFVIEAVLYTKYLKKADADRHKPVFYVLYALVANGVSFALGLYLAEQIPLIF